jgi:hypothetical protein
MAGCQLCFTPAGLAQPNLAFVCRSRTSWPHPHLRHTGLEQVASQSADSHRRRWELIGNRRTVTLNKSIAARRRTRKRVAGPSDRLWVEGYSGSIGFTVDCRVRQFRVSIRFHYGTKLTGSTGCPFVPGRRSANSFCDSAQQLYSSLVSSTIELRAAPSRRAVSGLRTGSSGVEPTRSRHAFSSDCFGQAMALPFSPAVALRSSSSDVGTAVGRFKCSTRRSAMPVCRRNGKIGRAPSFART